MICRFFARCEGTYNLYFHYCTLQNCILKYENWISFYFKDLERESKRNEIFSWNHNPIFCWNIFEKMTDFLKCIQAACLLCRWLLQRLYTETLEAFWLEPRELGWFWWCDGVFFQQLHFGAGMRTNNSELNSWMR